MESYADAGCVLKINAHCEACKMRVYEVLRSVSGAFSVTIDAEEGLAKISGEVDPNAFLEAVGRGGTHAELKWIKLDSPTPNRAYYHHRDRSYGSYNSSYGYGHGYRAIEQPHGGRRVALPEAEGAWCNTHRQYCASPLPEYSYNYGYLQPNSAYYCPY